MKRKASSILMIAFSVGLANNVLAQDIHFSQFYENALLRNPALIGIFSGDYKAGVNYRSQWSNVSVPYQTTLASAETRISVGQESGDCVSFGVTATYDKAGSINFNSMQVYPAINYNKSIEDAHNSYISVGFAGGYMQRSIDASKATFASQYMGGTYTESNASGENLNNTVMKGYDMGAGISLNSSLGADNNLNYYLGLSAYHIGRPKQSFSSSDAYVRLNTKWTGSMGFKFSINESFSLTAHGNYTKQGVYSELIAGCLVGWKPSVENVPGFSFSAGAFMRYKDAIIPTVKLDYKVYSITMSYDYVTSSLRPAAQGMGGMEISLYVRGKLPKNQVNTDRVQCPRFEQLMPEGF